MPCYSGWSAARAYALAHPAAHGGQPAHRAPAPRTQAAALPSVKEQPHSLREFAWLGSHPDEVSELAALLHEAAPRLGLAGYQQQPGASRGPVPRRPSYEVSYSLKERVLNAAPVAISAELLDWSRLAACVSSEMVALEDSPPAATLFTPLLHPRPSTAGSGEVLEINSGGRVLFCLFHPPTMHTPPSSRVGSPVKPGPAKPGQAGAAGAVAPAVAINADCMAAGLEEPAPQGLRSAWTAAAAGPVGGAPAKEQCVVVKFLSSRLLAQSEQFANELTRHVGICAPESRILRQKVGAAVARVGWGRDGVSAGRAM